MSNEILMGQLAKSLAKLSENPTEYDTYMEGYRKRVEDAKGPNITHFPPLPLYSFMTDEEMENELRMIDLEENREPT